MLIAGSDDGLYRISDDAGDDDPIADEVLDPGRVRRVRQFDALDGVFAATTTGLYHSPDGEHWTDLGVPETQVYAVGAHPDGERLYAGTRPARIFATTDDASEAANGDPPEWRELEGFLDLPSREEWRLPRHENLAQVRDVCTTTGEPDRVVAGVEVGGVHVSEDSGESWTERRSDVNDDVHELYALDAAEFVAATGYGLFHTTDDGRSWERLDEDVPQRYFRAVTAIDGTVYAAGAMANSSTWEDDDADPELFAYDDGGSLETVDFPHPDETVTGMTAVDGDLVAGTHRGTLVRLGSDGWHDAGEFPVPGQLTGRYTPLCWFES